MKLVAILQEGWLALNEFVKIHTALTDAVKQLQDASESPRLDADLLLARALDVPRSYLFAHPEDTLDPAAMGRFTRTIERRAAGTPIAYICGEKEFWSMNLMVTEDTLVPRPETETLVSQALLLLPREETRRVLDLGTGSGAIALALAKERPGCSIVATDCSTAALSVARENARQHDLPNIEFLSGDWLEPVANQRFDVIVANPPYVSEGDPRLEQLKHEPLVALASGVDGLEAIRRISADAVAVLNTGGSLLIEHGDEQHEAVAAILDTFGWSSIAVAKDLAGISRVTIARR